MAASGNKLQSAASQCASLLKFGCAMFLFRDTLCEPTVVRKKRREKRAIGMREENRKKERGKSDRRRHFRLKGQKKSFSPLPFFLFLFFLTKKNKNSASALRCSRPSPPEATSSSPSPSRCDVARSGAATSSWPARRQTLGIRSASACSASGATASPSATRSLLLLRILLLVLRD